MSCCFDYNWMNFTSTLPNAAFEKIRMNLSSLLLPITKMCFFIKLYLFWIWRTTSRDLVVTLNENHQIIHRFKIIEILNKFKIFKYHRIRKFSNLDFLSEKKTSECSHFFSARTWFLFFFKKLNLDLKVARSPKSFKTCMVYGHFYSVYLPATNGR